MTARETPRDILVTGFPSFLARKLVERILRREPESCLRLIVPADSMEKAKTALEHLGADEDRVDLLEGNVVAIDLGLSGTEYLEVVDEVTDIYHFASAWFLGVDDDELREVNIRGTRNIIDTAHEARQLERLNHLSTALVSGDRTGVILESELDEGQNFRNLFEKTKFEAELAMHDAMARLPISIYRPTIVVGDSETGQIDRMAGPYYLMNAIVEMPSGVPILMPGKGDFPLNMVPVDFVARAIHTISRDPAGVDETFHLADPNPLPARKVFDLVADHVGKSPPVGRMPYRLTKWVMKFPYVEKLARSPRQFLEEFNEPVFYNAMNTTELLDPEDRCPPFPSYVGRLVDFIEESDRGFDFQQSPIGGLLEFPAD